MTWSGVAPRLTVRCMTPVPKRLLALLATTAGSLVLAGPALADTYTVTSTADTSVCDGAVCTLRGAIARSQAEVQDDPAVVIELAPGATYETGSRLDIDATANSYTIEGAYATVKAKAGTTHGLFAISTQVEFRNLTLSGGSSDFGGAIGTDDADLAVDGVTLSGNAATCAEAIGVGAAGAGACAGSGIVGSLPHPGRHNHPCGWLT